MDPCLSGLSGGSLVLSTQLLAICQWPNCMLSNPKMLQTHLCAFLACWSIAGCGGGCTAQHYFCKIIFIGKKSISWLPFDTCTLEAIGHVRNWEVYYIRRPGTRKHNTQTFLLSQTQRVYIVMTVVNGSSSFILINISSLVISIGREEDFIRASWEILFWEPTTLDCMYWELWIFSSYVT